ncbi:hypothetical protein BJ508DRAFT_411708 [Ascobolus immersus RN42]|uniref:C2H2-type domain-containing protein n=1 Tax=Ascobolus immersus RN42 TaxID=1160509 RepID=A0A3N4IVQ4_ASCIM|nr:hypothetical protein BJ508DRAFT_411708 [Ascobolus immersus RN42]
MASPDSSLSSPSSSLSPPLSPVHAPRKATTPPPCPSDISSDTSGSVPGSPVAEDLDFQDQVTICRWEGCPAGDLGDMDSLVQHIHDTHIGSRKQKYSCEWEDCGRKGMTHASGYALRAHVRSHTREKPFYCSLPECDRSFTRSDALAKHMRTVHETEALRPSDPIPKGYTTEKHPETPSAPSRKRKSTKIHSERNTPSPPNGRVNGTGQPEAHPGASSRYWDAEDGLSEDEVRFPPKQLYAYLKKKLSVLEEEQKELKKKDEKWTVVERKAWIEKEKILEGVFVEEEVVVGQDLRIWKGMEKRKRVKIEEAPEQKRIEGVVGNEEREEEEHEDQEEQEGQVEKPAVGVQGQWGGRDFSSLLEAAEAAAGDEREVGDDEDGEGEDDDGDGDDDVDMDEDSS